MFQTLQQKIKDKSALVGVIGLGYVGLPLIRAFVDCGFNTIGFDSDPHKIEQLAAGNSYIKHIESKWIKSAINSDQFEPTCEMLRLAEADVLLICVPTPLDTSRNPDLTYVENTTQKIAATLRSGQLVILESTTYPGTTRDVVLPLLNASQLALGQDFFLAYSPEREDPGNPDHSAKNIPKVVGGIDEASRDLACDLYQAAVTEVVPVSCCEVAEASKILENTYRAVNIALINELKVLFDKLNIDIWEVIAAAKTKPFGFQAFYPGPGLGGHCIPIDPFYLSWLARQSDMQTRFIELAGEINTNMPNYVIHQVAAALNEQGKPIKGSKILILGVAYKPNIDDPRESPAFRIMELLTESGADLCYNDPYIPKLPQMRSFEVPDLTSSELSTELLSSADAVLIVTNHDQYDWSFIVKHAPLVIDTRNATQFVTEGREKIRTA
ncbi:MAG: UDP-N-acetyl-D-glucosamine dehydrogenase [Blastopirellula sp.]|nr:MAG: UDP-N-acetyl-D-glucosamine dehydrogenase [Blastopirellula sp.]